MHLLFKEKHRLEQTEIPVDLNQKPADIVFLSYSDSDLNSFAEAWKLSLYNSKRNRITLRLANIDNLLHPISVDLYLENTLKKSKAILIRLIGGIPYWEYGVNEVKKLAEDQKIPLAILSADGRIDKRLDDFSNLPVSTLRQLSKLCDKGGSESAHSALVQMALTAGLYIKPLKDSQFIPSVGFWSPRNGIFNTFTDINFIKGKPIIIIVFYRSFITANDISPIKSLYNSFKKKGLTPLGIFVNTLKDPKSAKWISKQIFLLNPACIINATSFSAKNNSGETPFSQSIAQVFQIALSTNDKSLWKKQERGMSPTDLAMHVALPEVDGSIFLGVASFKKKQKINKSLQFKQTKHQTFNYGISSITRKVCSWINLKTGGKEKLNPAFILSSYPGKKWQIAHAIGLDTISSLKGILEDNGFLKNNNNINLIQEIKNSKTLWSLKEYKESIKYIPHQLREKIYKKWGSPSTDHLVRGDFFSFNAFHLGRSLIAIQPERTNRYYSKKESYHDLSSVPCHSYIAFYLWMRHKINCSAIVHIGTHGTLEWLPGKSVALSENCWPEVLAGNIPVIYPFIINDPGEALQAKRRINAITIGHIPPKIVKVEKVKKLEFLETLLDEYSNADGLDPNRRERLKKDILDEAKNIGVDDTLDISNDTDKNEALEKIDRFVCDVKETQFGEGLHIFGREQKNNTLFNSKESASKEKDSLTRCLRGEKITPGPAGSPYRGKFDVLPSGRNIYANDHLSLPSRSAFKQGEKIAAEFLKDYLQENGDWPKNIIIDLWASATMRTNGEEFAVALCLLGSKPTWVDGTERISGFEIIPLAVMNRPRIDVTLRVSGLFRDIFQSLSKLYNQIIHALSKREECKSLNPFGEEKEISRVFGPKPGTYGINVNLKSYENNVLNKESIAKSWLDSCSWAINGNIIKKEKSKIKKLLKNSESLIHFNDLKETDILANNEYVKHQGGYSVAKDVEGGRARIFNRVIYLFFIFCPHYYSQCFIPPSNWKCTRCPCRGHSCYTRNYFNFYFIS